MRGPCAKRIVTAVLVAADGRRFTGTNYCENAQPSCPRGDMPGGVGYELCRDVCQQPAHAEVNAIAAAGDAARGSTIYIDHTWACCACKNAAHEAGVLDIVVVDDANQAAIASDETESS